jgi:ribosomal protein S27E
MSEDRVKLKVTQVERSQDVKEVIGMRVGLSVIPGVIALVLGCLMAFMYKGQGAGLGWVLVIGGVGAVGYGIYQLLQTRKVTEFRLVCPFCQATNVLTAEPNVDVRCVDCSRMIPIEVGKVLQVFQVRCGYCSHLNYYSEKSTGLICENCDSVIPIATDEAPEAQTMLERYTLKEDRDPYDLILTHGDPKSEKLIAALQHMLALNRNQIKKVLENLPQTLFTGIPIRKAELLMREITDAGGRAEHKLTEKGSSDKR